MATDIQKLYRIEVVQHGPEGVVSRLQSCATTAELSGAAISGAKKILDELGKDTEAAEEVAAG